MSDAVAAIAAEDFEVRYHGGPQPAVQGVTLTVALAFIIVNIVVDLLYVLVNPRIRSI